MTKILHLETATKNCSVALSENGRPVDVLEEASPGYSHAEKLHVFIDEILRRNRWKPADLDAVVVSEGPGSYTGLRIGVSAAKGLAYTLGIPMIAVPTLEVLARRLKIDRGFIIPLIDARRMEVYTTVFDKDYHRLTPVEPHILDETSFRDYLERDTCYFAGDAQEKTKQVVRHPHAVFTEYVYPSATQMIEPAYEKYLRKDFVDTAYFEPFYLKEFIVTRKKKPLL